ncbi:MAG: galactose mutarotase [Planctomycetes bacterium]|nr:galactose mutarotase [Planctomycetota bacterium]
MTLVLSVALSLLPLCVADAKEDFVDLDLKHRSFGKTQEDQPLTLYTLSHSSGLQVSVTDHGATLVSLKVPDRQGHLADIVLGSDAADGYLRGRYGAVIGRYANRIGHAKFTLDGQEIQVTRNAGKHHIHGGSRGFARRVWRGQVRRGKDEVAVEFTLLSQDGEEGYPGNVTCRVTYALTQDGDVKIHYQATTDKPTVINLTNHAYFNLSGADQGKIYDHVLHVDADAYTVSDKALIPTGEIRPVKDTALDFTTPQAIGTRIGQLPETRGYDHNYVFNDWDGTLVHRATVTDPRTGRVMKMLTTEPGMQLYTANHFRDVPGRQGASYHQHDAFCLETQHFPDSPNKPHFPSTVLPPGQAFDSVTVFRFSTQ